MEPAILLSALTEVVARSTAGEGRVGVAYSGGLDSSLVAKLASRSASITCYSCVTAGSHDSRRVTWYGRADGFDVQILVVAEEELPSLVAKTASCMHSSDPTKIAYSIPTVVVLGLSREKLVLAGNGADELFAGYEKYSRRPSERESEMRSDLVKSLEEAALLKKFAQSLDKRVVFPYLENEIVDLGRGIPVHQKISGDSRKAILRDAGKLAGLSASDRPKKAAQYSSGTLKMMKTLAGKDNKTLSEWTQSVISAHPLGKD